MSEEQQKGNYQALRDRLNQSSARASQAWADEVLATMRGNVNPEMEQSNIQVEAVDPQSFTNEIDNLQFSAEAQQEGESLKFEQQASIAQNTAGEVEYKKYVDDTGREYDVGITYEYNIGGATDDLKSMSPEELDQLSVYQLAEALRQVENGTISLDGTQLATTDLEAMIASKNERALVEGVAAEAQAAGFRDMLATDLAAQTEQGIASVNQTLEPLQKLRDQIEAGQFGETVDGKELLAMMERTSAAVGVDSMITPEMRAELMAVDEIPKDMVVARMDQGFAYMDQTVKAAENIVEDLESQEYGVWVNKEEYATLNIKAQQQVQEAMMGLSTNIALNPEEGVQAELHERLAGPKGLETATLEGITGGNTVELDAEIAASTAPDMSVIEAAQAKGNGGGVAR